MNRAVLATAGLALALLATGSALAGFTVPPNGPGAFAPRDACKAMPGAAAFRAALFQAVAQRDAAALANLAAADVVLDFGGGGGPDELRRRLAEPDEDADDLWDELTRALALGCAVSDGALVMPWFFGADMGDVDPFETLVVVGKGVPLRAAPSDSSAVQRTLSWQLVATDASFDPQARYQHVRLIGADAEGYVATAMLRSQVDYRVIAERVQGRWRITAIVAGD